MKTSSSISLAQILTLTCNEASRLLSARQDRALTAVERLALGLHVLICRPCRRYRQFLAFLRRLCRHQASASVDITPAAGLPQETRKRLQEQLLQAIAKNS